MKNIYFLLLVLLALSCNKSADFNNDSYTSPTRLEQSCINQNSILPDEMVDNIGVMHNQYLTLLYEGIDYTDDVLSQLQNNYNYLIDSLNIITISPSNQIETYSFLGYDSLYIVDFLNYIDGHSVNYNDIENKIGSILLKMNSDNLCPEIEDVLKTYFSVYKHSAEYWMPQSLGGSGQGQEILSGIYGDRAMLRAPTWKAILAADASGAAGGFIGGGFVAGVFFTVVNPAAFFAGVAFTAAWSSGTAAAIRKHL